MANILIMPRTGSAVESCVLSRWIAGEGDRVSEADAVCEVETDKATFDVPAGASGVVLKILRAEGEEVPALEPIAVIGVPGEDWRAALSAARAGGERQGPAAVEAAVHAAQAAVRAARAASRAAPAEASRSAAGPGVENVPRGRGEVSAASSPPAAPASEVSRVEASREDSREAVHEGALGLASSAAPLSLFASAPAARILDLRSRFKSSGAALGLAEVTIGDLVLFAVSRVLPRFPEAGAEPGGGAPRADGRARLAFAVETPRGDMWPVIRDADRLPLRGISAEARRLAAACRSGSIAPVELSGGTFAVANLGALGVESFAPILDPPLTAALGVGAVSPAAAPGPRMGLSLAVDRRALGCSGAARLLKAFCDAIADIDLLLAAGGEHGSL